MIYGEKGIFLLKNEEISYLFRVGKYGQLEHLHFGGPVMAEDAPALACRSGLGWGASVLLEEDEPASCLDAMALEWSGSGRGDYRESPLEWNGTATELRYVNYRILEGGCPMESSLPQAHGASETLEITLAQPGLELRLYYSLFGGALVRRAVVKNTGDSIGDLTKLMSFSVDLPGAYTVTTFGGGWIGEMRRTDTPPGMERVVNESLTGASSNRANPGFLLSEPDATETSGRLYGFNLIYSGNHYMSVQMSLQGLTRVMQGISPANFRVALAPGECFESPEAVLSWSDRGFSGLSGNMHRFVNDHIIPPYWRQRPRPVLYNSWEGCMFDFNQYRLLDLAGRARELGCELFVLDDGWFGRRDNDRAGLGDYTVNAKKLPGGLEGLAKKLRDKGMAFGLWFEPESVNPDSRLYREHPDWVLRDGHPDVLGRHQLLLDLSRREVRDYIVENVTRILDSTPITYVKWDMNRHSVALGHKAHSCVLGLYEVLARIFGPRPEILLESCSSGGNRFDLGMLCYGPQIWCSDNTDPIERLRIQGNLSCLYPQSTFGAHVSASPHAQTLRATPLSTRANVAFFGALGFELDLKHLLPVEIKEIKAQIAFYKQFRPVFQFGRFERTRNGWQVSDGKTTIAGIFHGLVPAAPGYEQLRVRGLEENRRYRVSSLDQSIRVGHFGSLLKHVLPVNIDPNGLILHAADGRVPLGDGQETFTASGGALMSGVMLMPLFRGTGYSKEQRNQGDFGSNVYVITEIQEENIPEDR